LNEADKKFSRQQLTWRAKGLTSQDHTEVTASRIFLNINTGGTKSNLLCIQTCKILLFMNKI